MRFHRFGIVLRGVNVEPRPDHSARLEPAHCRAICEEIGERLRFALGRGSSPMPARLRVMLNRFEERDTRDSVRRH